MQQLFENLGIIANYQTFDDVEPRQGGLEFGKQRRPLFGRRVGMKLDSRTAEDVSRGL